MPDKKSVVFMVLLALFGLVLAAGVAQAEDNWWPIKVYEVEGDNLTLVDYAPLQEKPSKKWHLVALIPHIKDVGWVSSNYGIINEARRQGVKVTFLEAGGYENLSVQLSQFDDALAMGADALLLGVISETALLEKVKEAKKRNVVQVAFQNPVFESPFTARVGPSVEMMTQPQVVALAEYFKKKGLSKVRTVLFPGPPGSGWAEAFEAAFKKFADQEAPGMFEILEAKYGETGKSTQLKLLEDALQTYGQVDLLWGCAPLVEVSYGVLEDRGMADKTIAFCEYQNDILWRLIERGEVYGMGIENLVRQGRIATDLAIRALEGKPFKPWITVTGGVITVDNIKEHNYTDYYAPKDYKMVFTLD